MRGSWYSERAEFVWSEQTLDTRQVSTIMYLVIHAVFTVMVSHESGTINKLIWLISVCAGEERKKQNKKQNIILAAKNNIPKAITASIIDNFRCRAVIRWLSGLKQKRGERIFFFFSLSCFLCWQFESNYMRGRFGEKLTGGECEKKRCFPLCVSWEDTYILRFESEAERVRERLEEREKRAGTWEKHAVCHFCTQHVSSLRFSRALRWISLEPDSSILAEFYLSTVWELSLWAWTCCCCQQTRDIHRTVSPGFFFAVLPLTQCPSVSDVLCYCGRGENSGLFTAAFVNVWSRALLGIIWVFKQAS